MADNRTDDQKKLHDLIKGIDIAMLTTVDGDVLRSRPMGTTDNELDGDIWFFTFDNSAKAGEVQQVQNVNVSYADTGKQRYVSVSGKAVLVHDRAKMEELWNPVLKVWFPDGLDTPNIVLLKVNAEQAEYWESDGRVARLVGFARALVTGAEYEEGENEKINLN